MSIRIRESSKTGIPFFYVEEYDNEINIWKQYKILKPNKRGYISSLIDDDAVFESLESAVNFVEIISKPDIIYNSNGVVCL